MRDNHTFVTPVRLRDMVYFGVRPTLRQCGFTPATVEALAKQGLIHLADKGWATTSTGQVIEGILRNLACRAKWSNAERMLQLRTVRANGDWGKYWAEGAKN